MYEPIWMKALHHTPANVKIIAELAALAEKIRGNGKSKEGRESVSVLCVARDLIQALNDANFSDKPDEAPHKPTGPRPENVSGESNAQWQKYLLAKSTTRRYENAQKKLKVLLLEACAILDAKSTTEIKEITTYSSERRGGRGHLYAVPKLLKPVNPNAVVPASMADFSFAKRQGVKTAAKKSAKPAAKKKAAKKGRK